MKNHETTLKIKYTVAADDFNVILKYIKEYNSVLRFTYNRLTEGVKTTKDLTIEQHKMLNVFTQSHLFNSAQYNAKAIYQLNNDKKVIFGGKKLFLDRVNNKISREEFQLKKLLPLFSVGEAIQKGNRLFKIIDENNILFKPCRDVKINLKLNSIGNNYKKKLKQLIKLQDSKQISISYKLDSEYVYIIFDNSKIESNLYKTKKNRVIAVDMNPNYLGYSIVDWKSENEYHIVDKGVFDISSINEKENNLKCSSSNKRKLYIKNKRDYEIIKIAHTLFELAKHYKCEIFSIEELNMKTGNLNKGKKLNKLINNQWNRNKFINVLKKLVNSSSTILISIKPAYSSILGNLIYREEHLPDMILSSIEIGRRGIEFQNQYLLKIKECKKNIIQPDFELVKERISKSLEELNVQSQFQNFQEVYSILKKSKVKYRFLLENSDISRVFRKNYKKSYVKVYSFA